MIKMGPSGPRRLLKRCAAMWIAAAILVAGGAGAARAADTGVLADVLSAAFLAKNLSLVCAQQNSWFHEDTKGSAEDGPSFSDHIEKEVLADLLPSDAGLVVISAANASRAVALGLVHVMGGGSAAEQTDRLVAWCETTVMPFVKGVLAQHDIRHDLYDRMLARAKQ